MNWQEYIYANIDRNRNRKQDRLADYRDIYEEFAHTSELAEARTLTEAYIKKEGSLANLSGLWRHLKEKLYPQSFPISHGVIVVDKLFDLITASPSFYLPSYLEVYDVASEKPYSESEIIEQYLQRIEDEYENRLPEDLLLDEEANELNGIWNFFLTEKQKIWIRSLDGDRQKDEILKFSNNYKIYCEYYEVADASEYQFTTSWITSCINEYKKLFLLSKPFTDESLDEMDILTEIQDELSVLLNRTVSFSRHYSVLHQKYLSEISVIAGEIQLTKKDRLLIQRWGNYFPKILLSRLLKDEEFIKKTVDLVRDLPIDEHWAASESLLNYLERVQPPLAAD